MDMALTSLFLIIGLLSLGILGGISILCALIWVYKKITERI